MKKPDVAVIFDMDGTIFDSERIVLRCWEIIGKKYGVPDIGEVFMQCIGTNKVRTREIVDEHYGKEFPYEKFSAESSVLFREMTGAAGLLFAVPRSLFRENGCEKPSGMTGLGT